MDELVKFNDYDGMLPKPKKFPDTIRFTIDGYPGSITNNYILDLFAEGTSERIIPTGAIDNLLEVASQGKPLSEPQYVCLHKGVDGIQYFILLTMDYDMIAIQTKYYQYFYYRYKGCQFVGESGVDPVGVMHNGHIVGLIMPMVMDKESLK